MKELELTIVNPTGLHARPAAVFVKTAKKFKSKIKI
ncbi:MAG: HPr family phosphocarrier protein, partial [Chloroflexi bacterium]